MAVRLAPITDTDLPEVASFMRTHLNRRIPESQWTRALLVPWAVTSTNHGFHLRQGDEVVGAYLAYYSERQIDGREEPFCNLGAWCVLEDHRFQGLRLLTALLAQKAYHFTDFSPSGNVIPLNRRLKFQELDTSTALVPNLPYAGRSRGLEVSEDPAALEGTLSGAEARIYRDHRATAAAHHLLVTTPHEHCYVLFRKDTRKNLRVFASPLHVSNPELFQRYAKHIGHHLLVRHAAAATLVELRLVGEQPPGSVLLRRSRARMFKSATLDPEQIDYLYSELTCLRW